MTRGERVSENIRAAVKERDRRQTEVAAEIGLSWPQWQRRMSGAVPWRVGEVVAVARALGVPVQELANGHER